MLCIMQNTQIVRKRIRRTMSDLRLGWGHDVVDGGSAKHKMFPVLGATSVEACSEMVGKGCRRELCFCVGWKRDDSDPSAMVSEIVSGSW
mmetsp:Transcript_27768/g.56075  ORF Transcript_27768/g.56075 Transcript_27768/m.56075 type:complete len:90 (+) Transcript_27768:1577-1846(+)